MLSALKPRILAVDDNEDICKFLRTLFQAHGVYDVEVVTNPLLAIATAKHFRPDLILIDMRMPECEGPYLASMIFRETGGQQCPVLFYTGLVQPESVTVPGFPDAEIGLLPKGTPSEGIITMAEEMINAHLAKVEAEKARKAKARKASAR